MNWFTNARVRDFRALEMDVLIKWKVWKDVKRSCLNPEDHIFVTHFHYKIKRKNGAFEGYKVRLVVREYERTWNMVHHPRTGQNLLMAGEDLLDVSTVIVIVQRSEVTGW